MWRDGEGPPRYKIESTGVKQHEAGAPPRIKSLELYHSR